MVDYGIFQDGSAAEPEADGAEIEVKQVQVVNKKDVIAVARNQVTVKEGALSRDLNRADEIVINSNEDLIEATDLQGRLKKGQKAIVETGQKYYKPFFDQYKTILNITNAAKSHVEPRVKALQVKMDSFATLQELERRKKEQEARDAAAELQRKIDAEEAELAKKEKATAKKSGVKYKAAPRIVVDAPVIPRTVEAKTEHGTSKLEDVLVGEATDYKSDFLRQLMIDYCMPAFKTMAQTAINKAIKAGALGKKGAPGIKVTKKTQVKHRRK